MHMMEDNIYEGGAVYFLWCTVIRARWPTHDGNIAIRGRALIVVAFKLLFDGGLLSWMI